MAERGSILSEENQPTVIAVCFVLALLATGFGVYDLLQIRGMGAIVQRVNNVNVEAINSQLAAASNRLAEIERRLGDLEKKAAAMPMAMDGAAPAEGAAPAPGKAGKKAP